MIIGTLGPVNTNSEIASLHYLDTRDGGGEVRLFDTPERSIQALIDKDVDKTILCIVYPKLNDLVFDNLDRILINEVFLCPTDEMVIGEARPGSRVCCHPAPVNLIAADYDDIAFVTSNSEAALQCSQGHYDVCVTTLSAARAHHLEVKKSFGNVNMGWAVFERKH